MRCTLDVVALAINARAPGAEARRVRCLTPPRASWRRQMGCVILCRCLAPVIVNEKKVRTFASEAAFEAWLAQHHATESEVWLRIYKKGSAVPTISVAQALDVVLCWGWIDGIRKGLDAASFLQRYTPRKPKSIWSQINRDHVARLVAAGRMTPHGQLQVDRAKADGRWDAAYAPMRTVSPATLPADLRAAIEVNPAAAATLQRLGRPHLFALTFRLGTVKTPAGRARKIATLVDQLASGNPPGPELSLGSTGATRAAVVSVTMARATRAVVTETRPAKASTSKASKAGTTKAGTSQGSARKT